MIPGNMTMATIPTPSIFSGSIFRRVVSVVVAAIVLWIFLNAAGLTRTISITTATSTATRTTDKSGSLSDGENRVILKPPNPLLCEDEDEKLYRPRICDCRDPSDVYPSNRQIWYAHHDRMVAAAEAAATKYPELDVVLIGDSIIEHFNGTRMMGQHPAFGKYYKVFQRYFDKSSNPEATLQGIALGSSGDTTSHLLWHMENGVLPETLQPKVWFVMIGTNNMGRDGCNKRATLAGILHVVKALHEARPEASVLVHAILPRSDAEILRNEQSSKYGLGVMKGSIQWINIELERNCKMQPNCHFMDVGSLFLKSAANGEQEINPELMDDALHPNLEGYRVWAPQIVDRVKELIRK